MKDPLHALYLLRSPNLRLRKCDFRQLLNFGQLASRASHVAIALPQTKPHKVNYEALEIGVVFVKFQNAKPTSTNVKPPTENFLATALPRAHTYKGCQINTRLFSYIT